MLAFILKLHYGASPCQLSLSQDYDDFAYAPVTFAGITRETESSNDELQAAYIETKNTRVIQRR